MTTSKIGKSTICLNMIVKNEAHIIKRCLESVIPYIDTWVISDTGSTDGTQDVIRDIMKDVPGELIEREWKDFGHNRDEVLQYAKDKADYSLIIDADEWLECEKGFDFKNLTADSYYLNKTQGHNEYLVRNIVSNKAEWYWEGVIHETLSSVSAKDYGILDEAVIQARQEGARSLDPLTYRKDAGVLTRAMADEPDNTRYQFYLAQSWRDAREPELAIINYKKRIEMGGWDEEVFISKYEIAFAMERLGEDWKDCMAQYLDAWSHTPRRAEPLYRIGLHYFEEENWPIAWLYLKQAAEMPKPEGLILFIEDDVYTHFAIINAAVAAGNMGYYQEMRNLHKTLLDRKILTEEMAKLIQQNQNYFEGLEAKQKDKAA